MNKFCQFDKTFCLDDATIYIIGSLNDSDENIKQNFSDAEKYARKCGFKHIMNPAMFTRGHDFNDLLRIRMIYLNDSHAILLLNNYVEDKIARLELDYSIRHDLPIFNTQNLHLWKLNISAI